MVVVLMRIIFISLNPFWDLSKVNPNAICHSTIASQSLLGFIIRLFECKLYKYRKLSIPFGIYHEYKEIKDITQEVSSQSLLGFIVTEEYVIPGTVINGSQSLLGFILSK